MPSQDHRITLVTRVSCHLCEQASDTLRALRAELGFTYREIDVDSATALQDEFGDRVPVVLLDGREHAYWRVDELRLRRALSR